MEIVLYGLLLLLSLAFVVCLVMADHYKNEVQYYRDLNERIRKGNKNV
jgi:hypothetical protein